jgi:predicted DNA-binding transcriptional regulator AlpA
MNESLTTVALEANPDRAIPITEVAHMTGYNSQYLRRLEKSGLIPQSHKVGGIVRGGVQKGGTRAWFASEVEKIMAYKGKMVDKTEKRMATLYKKGNAARRKS